MRRFIAPVVAIIIGLVLILAAFTPTNGQEVGEAPLAVVADDVLFVDGIAYDRGEPLNAAVSHYYTPYTGQDPVSAFTARNVWTGNGSDNLPCEGGYHWIDNENLLTISHCLEVTTDTTTTTSSTSTSSSKTAV